MKETFYLKHDYNSRNDEKMLKLRRKYLDGSGYGIYWMLLEKLAESSEGRLKLENVEDIAFELHLDSKRIADVVHSYDLFEIDKMYFWSNRLLSDLTEREEKSKRAVLANKVRWDRERKKIQMDSKRTPRRGEERRGKKSSSVHAGGFEKFWKAYPKRKNKQQALKAFEKIPASKLEAILPAIEAQKKTQAWRKDNGQFIPYPATWLNAGAWDDELEVDIPKATEDYKKEYEAMDCSDAKFVAKYSLELLTKIQ